MSSAMGARSIGVISPRATPASASAISSSALKVVMSESVSATAASISPVSALAGSRCRSVASKPVAQAVERRAQIVRDGVGDLAHALHQALDAVEHGVEILGQRVELVMRLADGHAARQIAGDDLGAGAVDRVQPRQHVAAHQGAADQAEQQDQRRPSRAAWW